MQAKHLSNRGYRSLAVCLSMATAFLFFERPALAAKPGKAADTSQQEAVSPEHSSASAATEEAGRTKQVLQDEVKSAMGLTLPNKKLPSDDRVREMVVLFQEIAGADHLRKYDQQKLMRRLGTRLLDVVHRIDIRNKHQAKNARKTSAAKNSKVSGSGIDTKSGSDEKSVSASKSASDTKSAIDTKTLSGGAGGGVQSNGQDLVELIQTVVRPESWDVNGGEGSIFFYSPLKDLVIRQTGEVHGEISETVEALRK